MGQAKIINSFAFYVGDSVVADVLGSINSGLKPCYFNWKKNKSQRTASINNLFTFEKYDELKDFIKKEGEYNPEIISKLELGVHKMNGDLIYTKTIRFAYSDFDTYDHILPSSLQRFFKTLPANNVIN